MNKKLLIVALVTVSVVAVAGATVAIASGDSDVNVTGAAADQATAAALAATAGGTANSVELDGENGATWEVEVTKPDGTTVDVRLDEAFGVVVIEGDSEEADHEDASD